MLFVIVGPFFTPLEHQQPRTSRRKESAAHSIPTHLRFISRRRGDTGIQLLLVAEWSLTRVHSLPLPSTIFDFRV